MVEAKRRVKTVDQAFARAPRGDGRLHNSNPRSGPSELMGMSPVLLFSPDQAGVKVAGCDQVAGLVVFSEGDKRDGEGAEGMGDPIRAGRIEKTKRSEIGSGPLLRRPASTSLDRDDLERTSSARHLADSQSSCSWGAAAGQRKVWDCSVP